MSNQKVDSHTKVFWEEGNANNVEEEGNNLRNNHINMPIRYNIREVTAIKNHAYHVVISNATIISSFKIRAVNEIETICRNSFSKRTRDIIMIAAPA